ncbi:transcriptional regulator domain-containing protein [Reyranella soli]|uniref:Transcriptional regulator-like domain-containing protein n=1 Tax=Reyranella soli TaxID=1230389 RepID=A0A512NF77_9HYPH|nr:DUF6499 domain-containing protein [Reyranella soli]GEP57605.1 hypothetical protein RSO01_47710 [Reyranella soli]
MSRAYWRSLEAYEKLQTFDDPGFAFQYLSRNPDFAKGRERLQQMDRKGTLDSAELNAFARRWGLLFRQDD